MSRTIAQELLADEVEELENLVIARKSEDDVKVMEISFLNQMLQQIENLEGAAARVEADHYRLMQHESSCQAALLQTRLVNAIGALHMILDMTQSDAVKNLVTNTLSADSELARARSK